ncbi:methyltransferase domain-containing protein [archaeon]|nr:methyltransferase domain-containing protein [archaeon]
MSKKEADKYISNRFKFPIYIIEHENQVEFVKKAISQFNILTALELGCGPGRVTRDITNVKKGLAIDSSEPMLNIAKSLKLSNWNFKKADVFKFKSVQKYDLIFTFRFIFHFNKGDREKIYSMIHKSLKKNGSLVFEARNKDVAGKIKSVVKFFLGKEKYKVYQKLYTHSELVAELEKNGFKIIKSRGNICNFWLETLISKVFYYIGFKQIGIKIIRNIEKNCNNPLSWTVLCEKK